MLYDSNLEIVRNIRRGGFAFTQEPVSQNGSEWTIFVDALDLLDDNFVQDVKNLLTESCTQDKLNKDCCAVSISCHKKKIFSKEEIKVLNKLNDIVFKETGREITFYESEDFWSLKDVKQANDSIDKLVEKTKKLAEEKQFTPLEQFMYVYSEVTKKVFNKEDDKDRDSLSRSIYSVLNQDKIVCVGYAAILKEVCNQLGIPNIHCFTNIVSTEDKNGTLGGHVNNIVYIKDEKYGVDGYFYADACWDSLPKYTSAESSFTFCLTPLQDIEHITSYKLSSNQRRISQIGCDMSFSGLNKRLYISEDALMEMESISGTDRLLTTREREILREVIKEEFEKQRRAGYDDIEVRVDETINSDLGDFKPFMNPSYIVEEVKKHMSSGGNKYNLGNSILSRVRSELKDVKVEAYVSLHQLFEQRWNERNQNLSPDQLKEKEHLFEELLTTISPEYKNIKFVNTENIFSSEFYPYIVNFYTSIDNLLYGKITADNIQSEKANLSKIFGNILPTKFFFRDLKAENIFKVVEQDFVKEKISELDYRIGYIKHYIMDKRQKLTEQKMSTAINRVLSIDPNRNPKLSILLSAYYEKEHFDKSKCSSWLAKPVGLFINDMVQSLPVKDNEIVERSKKLYAEYKKSWEIFDEDSKKQLSKIYQRFVNLTSAYLSSEEVETKNEKEKYKIFKNVEYSLERLAMYGVVDTSKIDFKLANKVLSFEDNCQFMKLKNAIQISTEYIKEELSAVTDDKFGAYVIVFSLSKIDDELEESGDLSFESMAKLYEVYGIVLKQISTNYFTEISHTHNPVDKLDIVEMYAGKLKKYRDNLVGEFDDRPFDEFEDLLLQEQKTYKRENIDRMLHSTTITLPTQEQIHE